MNWVLMESHNMLLTLCGVFYSVLCIFSIVTGLMYASGKKELNPIELSDSFMKKYKNKEKLKKFTIKMGWVTFVVGIVQGITALCIFKGYHIALNIFAIFFTLFSICSVLFKLKGKINLFPIMKLVFYLLILIILLLNGIHNYSAEAEVEDYLISSDSVQVTKIKEGYFFDGYGNDIAIIFFPGARVQYTAYAKLMYSLADDGYDCFLLSVPLNLAFFDISKPNSIMNHYSYDYWYLSGHSLGGVAASTYAVQNSKVDGIIHLASYPTKKIPDTMKYLSIYGSEDKVLNHKKFELSKKYYPEEYQIIEIDGGNHSFFANYGDKFLR